MTITFPSARRPTRALVTELLADRPEPFTRGATVGTKMLPGSTGARPLPYVRVTSDGTSRDSQLRGRQVLRFNVWHDDEGFAEDLALLLESLLLGAHTNGVRSYGELSGVLLTHDEEADLPLAFFTLTARLEPVQIT